MTWLKLIWKDRSIALSSEIRLMHSLVTSNLPVYLWIMDSQSRALKRNTSHGKEEVLLQDTTHLIQRPCYQRGSPCQDPGGNRITLRPPDHRKETQTAVVWTCLPFIKSGKKTHLARHVKGEEDKANRRRGGRTTSGNGQAWRAQRAMENREKQRKLVVKSSVVPQRPSRLRDRWWWDNYKVLPRLEPSASMQANELKP